MQDAQMLLPEGARGAFYFAQVTNDWSDWRNDWVPTLEHFPVYKKNGGKAVVENAILAHRLCNRLDRSLRVDRSHESDLEDQESPRGRDPPNNVLTGNTEGGEIPAVVAIVEATERVESSRDRPLLCPRRCRATPRLAMCRSRADRGWLRVVVR